MANQFQYHPDILSRFPDTVGGVILAKGLANGPAPEELQRLYWAEQQAVLEKIGSKPLSEIPSLNAWRRAFRAFDVNPTKYRSAAEALLRRLTKKGDIPTINILVDLANLVSIRYALPVAAFDIRALQRPVTVHFSEGSEWFRPLGRSESEHPQRGEVIFSDEERLVVARRWCWRQSHESAAQPDTTKVLITVETQHPGGRDAVEAAMADLLVLLPTYAGGNFESAILDAGRTAFYL